VWSTVYQSFFLCGERFPARNGKPFALPNKTHLIRNPWPFPHKHTLSRPTGRPSSGDQSPWIGGKWQVAVAAKWVQSFPVGATNYPVGNHHHHHHHHHPNHLYKVEQWSRSREVRLARSVVNICQTVSWVDIYVWSTGAVQCMGRVDTVQCTVYNVQWPLLGAARSRRFVLSLTHREIKINRGEN